MTTPMVWGMLARRQRRFWRSPKGYLLMLLTTLAIVAGSQEGLSRVGPFVLAAALTAALLDVSLTLLTRRAWIFPDGALLSGLIVALVLSPREPWSVAATAAALAIFSKHLLRNPWAPRAHVFNPAAAGLLAVILLFNSSQSWWGALPDLPMPVLLLLLAGGYLVVDRIHKFWQVLTFLGAYFGLFTVAAFMTMGGTAGLAEVFRVPFINAALFFALVMLTDPPTSPNGEEEQMRFGVVVAGASVLAFLLVPGLAFLPLGLLTGNAWLAWRRARGSDQVVVGCPADHGAVEMRALDPSPVYRSEGATHAADRPSPASVPAQGQVRGEI